MCCTLVVFYSQAVVSEKLATFGGCADSTSPRDHAHREAARGASESTGGRVPGARMHEAQHGYGNLRVVILGRVPCPTPTLPLAPSVH